MDASLLAARLTAARPPAVLRDDRDKPSSTRDDRDDLMETRDDRDDLSKTRDVARRLPLPVELCQLHTPSTVCRRILRPSQFVVIRVIRGKSPSTCLTFPPRAAKMTAYSAGAGRSSA